MSLYLWIYVIIFVQTLRMYPLEEEIATHSSILAWKIPWTEAPGRLQSMGLQSLDTTERLHLILDLNLVMQLISRTLSFCKIETP